MSGLDVVPEALNIPPKLEAVIDNLSNYRYFLIEGGRGGGKTQGIARLISYICEKRRVRVVCGRETQNTIEESVYTVLSDIISQYDLNFSVLKDKISHRTTDSSIKFKGFREQGAVNIKGLEGVDILWVDEAQAITANTLKIILPTIRKQNSIVIWTMNRYLKSDPVFKAMKDREDCLHIHIDYDDNPFCSDILLNEAAVCKANSKDEYQHIWKGEPLADAHNYLFNEDALEACLTRRFPHDAAKYHGKILGCDVARYGHNYSAGLVLKQAGPDHWAEEALDTWRKFDAVYTTGKFVEMMGVYRPDVTVIDADGMGGPVYDFVADGRSDEGVIPFHGGSNDGISDKERYRNWRTFGYLKLEEMINNGRLRLRSQKIVDQLKEIKYRYTIKAKKYVIPKEELIEHAQKKGVPYESPDEADSLMMAATQVEAVKKEQDKIYEEQYSMPRSAAPQSYAHETNILA